MMGHTAAQSNHDKATKQYTMPYTERYMPLQSVTDETCAWGHAICHIGQSTIAEHIQSHCDQINFAVVGILADCQKRTSN